MNRGALAEKDEVNMRTPRTEFTSTATQWLSDGNRNKIIALVEASPLGKGAVVKVRSATRSTGNDPKRHFTIEVICKTAQEEQAAALITSIGKETGVAVKAFVANASARKSVAPPRQLGRRHIMGNGTRAPR